MRWCQKEEAAPPALLAGPRCSPARAACRSEEAPEGGGRAGNRPAPLTGPRRAARATRRSEEAPEGGDRAAHRPVPRRPRCSPE